MKAGRKPLPTNKRLQDGLPSDHRQWLKAMAKKLQVSQQFIVRVAIQRLRKAVENEEVSIDITSCDDR